MYLNKCGLQINHCEISNYCDIGLLKPFSKLFAQPLLSPRLFLFIVLNSPPTLDCDMHHFSLEIFVYITVVNIPI